MHAARYDPATRNVEADVCHASVWMITVNTDTRLTAVETDHFRIHFHAP